MKKCSSIALSFALLFTLMGCGSKQESLFNIGEALVIEIRSGLTGDIVRIAGYNDFINTLTNNVNSLKYEKTAEAAEKDFKYVYRLTWYDKRDYQIAQVYITEEDGHQIVHDGYYYEVSNNENIDTSIIDLWLSTCLESQPKPDDELSSE